MQVKHKPKRKNTTVCLERDHLRPADGLGAAWAQIPKIDPLRKTKKQQSATKHTRKTTIHNQNATEHNKNLSKLEQNTVKHQSAPTLHQQKEEERSTTTTTTTIPLVHLWGMAHSRTDTHLYFLASGRAGS